MQLSNTHKTIRTSHTESQGTISLCFRGSVLSKTLKGAGGQNVLGGRQTPQGDGHGPLVGGGGSGGPGQPQPGDQKWSKVLDLNRAGAAMDAETFTQVSEDISSFHLYLSLE